MNLKNGVKRILCPIVHSVFPKYKVCLKKNGAKLIHCRIINRGSNNELIMRGGVYKNCCFEFYGSNNRIEFGENCSANEGSFYIEDSYNLIAVGDNTSFAGKIHIACTESKTISVGDACLFSSEIVIRSGDSHSVIDMNGNRINQAANVEIGNHVWVGHRVLINKGVCIPENCIIGTGAVLTKAFIEENTVIAGVPAKVVKRDVNWMTKRV